MASIKEIDWATVENLCKIQCIGEEIAMIVGVDYDTLNTAIKREHDMSFSDYFKKHSSAGRASLRRTQFAVAVEDKNPTMLIWLGKQHLGQRDQLDTNNVHTIQTLDKMAAGAKEILQSKLAIPAKPEKPGDDLEHG